jgi:hypothetical protein
MESNPLLPLPERMQIDQIQTSENEVSITVIATVLATWIIRSKTSVSAIALWLTSLTYNI